MLGAASDRVRILYRVKPRSTVVPLANRREFFSIRKGVEGGYELNEHRWKNWEPPPRFGKLSETHLVKHLMHIPTDKDKIMELEKYRISMRHLAVMMGKNPDEFTFEEQQKAIRYLMPGYSLFGEATPRVNHPAIWMQEYTTEKDFRTTQRFNDIQGRPENMFYWSSTKYTGDYLGIINLITFLERKEREIVDRKATGDLTPKEAEILLTGDVEVYFSDFIKRRNEENWSTENSCLRFRKELEAIYDSVWYWPRSLLASENLRTKLTTEEYLILSQNFVIYDGMDEFFDRYRKEKWSKDKLREELIKNGHNARYWPRHYIHKNLTPRRVTEDNPYSMRDHNREMKSVYFELFGQTNIPGHQIKYPKFDPVLYNKRRTDKLHPYKIQLTMTNPVRLQDKKMKSSKKVRIAATESVNYELRKMSRVNLGGLLPRDCKSEDQRTKVPTMPKLSIPEEYHATMVDHINVLGIDFYNRECSTATGISASTNTVNVTVIKNGTGLYDINGVKLVQFFNYDTMCIMKALAPFSLLQQLKSYDMIIAVQGLGGGNVATYMSKGRDYPRQNYNSTTNVQALPYKEATPYFGQGPDQHIALNNGGMKIASLVARGICEALMPLIPKQERALLYKSGLMIPDVRTREGTWKTGAGTMKIRGRKTKKWRKR